MQTGDQNFNTISVHKLTGAMGAMISGVDLSENISDQQFDEIRRALFSYGAIGFRDQDLSFAAHSRFAKKFGTLEVHPIVNGMEDHPEIIKMHKPAGTNASFGVGWHSDNSFLKSRALGPYCSLKSSRRSAATHCFQTSNWPMNNCRRA